MLSDRRRRGNGILYGLLALLTLLVSAYELQYLRYVSLLLLHPTQVVRAPFDYSPEGGIGSLKPEAVRAGIKEGDTLLQINGEPFTGLAALQRNLSRSTPHQAMLLLLREAHPGQTSAPAVGRTIFLEPVRPGPIQPGQFLRAVLQLAFVPLLCLGLGFSLVATRIRDFRAWIVLALMISLSQQYRIFGWEGTQSLPLLLYQEVAPLLIGIALLLFAIYFPVRAGWDAAKPWRKWLLMGPLACAAAITALSHIVQYRAIGALPHLTALLNPVEDLCTILNLCSVPVFIGEVIRRIRNSGTNDERRRMKILLAGTLVGGLPLTLLTIAGLVSGKSTFDIAPLWLTGVAVLLLGTFPCTLILVMVLSRAPELDVMIRSALLLVFARKGLTSSRILLPVIAIGPLWAVYALDPTHAQKRDLLVVVAALTALGEYLFIYGIPPWLDKRLFRNEVRIAATLNSICSVDCAMTDSFCASVMVPIAEALQVPRMGLLLRRDNEFEATDSLGMDARQALNLDISSVAVQHLAETRRPALLYFNDPDSWTHRLTLRERAACERMNAELLVPLFSSKQMIGVLALSRRVAEEPFSGEHIRHLSPLPSVQVRVWRSACW